MWCKSTDGIVWRSVWSLGTTFSGALAARPVTPSASAAAAFPPAVTGTPAVRATPTVGYREGSEGREEGRGGRKRGRMSTKSCEGTDAYMYTQYTQSPSVDCINDTK